MSGRSKRTTTAGKRDIADPLPPPSGEPSPETASQAESDLRPRKCTVHETACWLAGVSPATNLADAKRQVLEENANSLAGKIYRALKEDILAGTLQCTWSEIWYGFCRLIPNDAINWAKDRRISISSELAILAERAGSAHVQLDGVDQGNADQRLAALFDNVGIAQLETMFSSNGQWKKWAERAHVNGLNAARKERGKFNPYLAALWWLKTKKPEQWSWEQCARRLAKNLPARSRGSESQLTGVDE